jgi:drug/metabolite transporter (DMT)-like permease
MLAYASASGDAPDRMLTGEIAALGTAFCWAFTGIFFAEAARRIGALRVNLLRLPIALVLLSGAVLATGTSLAALTPTRAGLLAASGLVGLTVGDLALFAALVRIGPRLITLLMALAPVFATLAAAVGLRELPGALELTGMAITLAGVAWVVLERRDGQAHPLDHRGALALGVLAAVCQGVGLVLAKAGMAGEVPPLAATWVRMGVATAGMWLLALAAGRTRGLEIAASARRALAPVLGGAVSGPFVGVWMSLVAARYTDVGVAATLMATTPVLIIPLVMRTEGYRPTARAVVGALVAIAGVALLFVR